MSDEKIFTNEDMDNSIDRILKEKRKSPMGLSSERTLNVNKSGNATNVKRGINVPDVSSRKYSEQIGVQPGCQNSVKRDIKVKNSAQNANSHSVQMHSDGVRTFREGRKILPVLEDEDSDVKIAPSRKHSHYEKEKASIKVHDDIKKQKVKNIKKDENENSIGGSLVVSLMRAVVYLVFVSVIAAVLSIAIINIGNDVYAFVKNEEMIDVTVPEGATCEDIAEILYENGVIKYKSIFKFYGSLKHIDDDFVAGDYTVSPMMNYKSLYNEFKEKSVSGTSWITIPEGYTTDEIIDLMLSYDIGGSKEDYVKAINEDEYNYWFVDELDSSGVMTSGDRFYRLDGYLFPDTYEFYNASTAHTVINKMLSRFDEVYTDVFKQRASELGYTTDQMVILASIIEKEAGHSSDFRNVSSVFHNRLKNKAAYPKFESDATVVYAITHITGERPNKVDHDTISYDSPYNTYLYDSFPPGAISNPGMNALKYSVYPADTNYYFFVSDSAGNTYFASSKAEHDRNVASVAD